MSINADTHLGTLAGSSLKGEHPDDDPGKKFWDRDRRVAKDFKRAFDREEGEESIAVKYRRYQKWYARELYRDQLTIVGYKEAADECFWNNMSDFKPSCRKIVEDYAACLHVYRAKYGVWL